MNLRRRDFMKTLAATALATIAHPPALALANRTSVSLSAPDRALRGSAITITLHVTHRGNNFTHFTNWVLLKADDQEIARWEFSAFNRPPSENFTLETTLEVQQTVQLVAEGNCNLHGSDGKAFHTITVTDS